VSGVPVPTYITNLRAHIGHELILLPGASAVVYDDRGHILLVRRGDNGRWSVPAGMIDPGEQPAQAAVREVLEETGVHCEVDFLAGVATHPVEYPNGDRCEYLNVWFRCRAVAGTPRADGDESLAAAWFPPEALPPLDPWSELRISTAASPGTWFATGPHAALTNPENL